MNKRLSRICIIGATGLVFTTAADLWAQLVDGGNATAEQVVASSNGPDKQANKLANKLADKLADKNRFLRMKKSESGEPLALQTAITTFKPRTGYSQLRVDLVGAVHVGDREYYQQLNRAFEKYDAVLYELVAPQGTVVPKGGRKGSGGNPISMLQGMTKSMLNLASQMDEVDYTKANFVHADMSPKEMQDAMAKRGETPMTVALDALSEMMKQTNLNQQQASAAGEPLQQLTQDPLSLLFDSQRDTKLKLMMAEQFSTMGTDVMGGTVNRVLVEDRNKAALRVFQKELAKGKKRIAIFYGAAHLPDFEVRLEKEFDLVRAETRWLDAWDLTKPSKHKADDPVDSLFRALLNPPAQ